MRHSCQCLPNVGQVQNPAEGVQEDLLPNAPVPESESSPTKVSVTSSECSALGVGLRGAPVDANVLETGVDEAWEQYRNAAAAPTPANAPISQDLSHAPMPFPKMRRPK